jgi:NiFe hydrogenase small subunit HydA
VVNVPGCPPIGDNFTEAVAAIVYFLQGFGPLPEFDELGRPAWQFGETVHRHCTRGAYYEEGKFAKEFGDKECLVEIGCWGPVVNCNITSRGAINHVGGCMNAGGACIGCTMPGFPDKFTPFYKAPPGSLVSSTVSRMVGSLIARCARTPTITSIARCAGISRGTCRAAGRASRTSRPRCRRSATSSTTACAPRPTARSAGRHLGQAGPHHPPADPAVERELPGGEDEKVPAKEGR